MLMSSFTFLSGKFGFSSFALATQDYSELGNVQDMSFDQIVNDLNHQVNSKSRTKIQSANSNTAFSQVQIHTSFGFTQGIHYFQTQQESFQRFNQGLLLSVGVDLFSPQWIAEGVIKNYGSSQYQSETLNLREFELRLNYRQRHNNHLAFRLFNGLGARSLKWTVPARNIQYQSNTPVYQLGGVLDLIFAGNFSLGLELSGQTSLIAESFDRNSVALSLKFDNYF